MKQLLLTFGLMAMTCLGLQAENRIVTDTVDGKKRVIELQDTVVDGRNVTDTLSVTTYEDPVGSVTRERIDKVTCRFDDEYFLGLDKMELGCRANRGSCLHIRPSRLAYLHHLLLPLQEPQGEIPLGGASLSQWPAIAA